MHGWWYRQNRSKLSLDTKSARLAFAGVCSVYRADDKVFVNAILHLRATLSTIQPTLHHSAHVLLLSLSHCTYCRPPIIVHGFVQKVKVTFRITLELDSCTILTSNLSAVDLCKFNRNLIFHSRDMKRQIFQVRNRLLATDIYYRPPIQN